MWHDLLSITTGSLPWMLDGKTILEIKDLHYKEDDFSVCEVWILVNSRIILKTSGKNESPLKASELAYKQAVYDLISGGVSKYYEISQTKNK